MTPCRDRISVCRRWPLNPDVRFRRRPPRTSLASESRYETRKAISRPNGAAQARSGRRPMAPMLLVSMGPPIRAGRPARALIACMAQRLLR